MNPPLLFISLVTAMLSSSAQITVDISNIATVGDTLFLAEDTVIGSSLDLGEAAGNQVWDFTSLTEHKPDGGILENPKSEYNFDIFFADYLSQELFSLNFITRELKIYPIENYLYINSVNVFNAEKNQILTTTNTGRVLILQLP